MKSLREDTLIPLGFAIAFFGGGALWVGTLQSRVAYLENRSDKLESRVDVLQNTYNMSVEDIRVRLARIETDLSRLVNGRK